MKREIRLITSLFLVTILLFTSNCKKDSNENQIPPPIADNGYDIDEAATIMTLAAIAYTAEGSTAQMIKDSIITLLADPALATGGQWELAWGPGINATNSNLVYLAKNNSTHPASYAMAVRGTSIYSISDILQDLQVFTLVPFTYGLPGDSIANGSMIGLNALLETQDPVSGKTLIEFLPEIVEDQPAKMYFTGHSQGGALAPLLTYWFITQSGVADHFILETYAFAGPSVSNDIFKTNFFNSLPAAANFHMVANSLDVIPYFWAQPDTIVINHIPAVVPHLYRLLLKGFEDFLQFNHIKYTQLDEQIYIGSFPPADTLGNIHPSDTLQWYNHWMKVEHTHNNYLKLLNAHPI